MVPAPKSLPYFDQLKPQELAGQVHRALEMADDEIAALDTITRTLTEIVPGCDAELLLADNSKAHLSQAAVAGPSATGPGCLVDSPFACAAVRNGTTMSFPSSDALDACPHLRDRAMGECSAVCVPVSFMGRAMGVFHTVGPPGQPASEDQAEALGMLATQAGARIGMLRSMVRTQIQASTDALTGLMNRRTMEARTRDLLREYRQYTLVMADLDHFKLLNDTHGHQAGDRALRAFAEVCRATARQGDLFARWGGEEFAFVCPDTHPTEALPIIDRVRLELSARVAASDIPRFTASFGLAWSGDHSTAEDIIHTADAALYRAKDAGRDRAVIGRPDLTGPHPDHIKVVPDGSAIAADSSPLGPIPFS